MDEMIFSGGSHYGVGALKSLQAVYNRIYILQTNSEDILKLKRPSDVIIKNFNEVECPIVFLGGHSKLITPEQLSKKTYINVHGALLPKYRGMHSTFWAIMNGEKQLGITYHLVNEEMDAGDIIAQFSFDFNGQTVAEINQKIDSLVLDYTGKVVQDYCHGNIVPQKQQIEQATWGCKRNIEDCKIDFNWNNQMIRRFFLALTEPYPRPLLDIRNDYYEVLEYDIKKYEFWGAIGRVLNIDKNGAWIKTQEGFLIVKSIREYKSRELRDPRKVLTIGYRF